MPRLDLGAIPMQVTLPVSILEAAVVRRPLDICTHCSTGWKVAYYPALPHPTYAHDAKCIICRNALNSSDD